jgi:hypothetical protein
VKASKLHLEWFLFYRYSVVARGISKWSSYKKTIVKLLLVTCYFFIYHFFPIAASRMRDWIPGDCTGLSYRDMTRFSLNDTLRHVQDAHIFLINILIRCGYKDRCGVSIPYGRLATHCGAANTSTSLPSLMCSCRRGDITSLKCDQQWAYCSSPG